MSARQCRLVVIAKQDPFSVPKGSRQHNPRQVALAAINKGKKYPYASTRQNTREVWRRARWNERRDEMINKLVAKHGAAAVTQVLMAQGEAAE